MEHSMKHKWYVVQTKPLNEDKVCQQFKRVTPSPLGGEGRGEGEDAFTVETFNPKIKSVSLSKGDKIHYKPLFPNYIFVHWDLTDPANHHLVKYTRGVNKVLGAGMRPVPISDEVVELIKSRVSEGEETIEQSMFKKGDMVRLKYKHLKELIGVLERPVSSSGRVAVLLNLFNRQMRVNLHCADIARA